MDRITEREQTIKGVMEVLNLAERLKFEMRHSRLSNGDQESVADHVWQMSLMAVLMHRSLEHPVEIGRALKLVIVHDIVEAIAGDIPFFETGARKAAKRENEERAIERIRDMLSPPVDREIYDLWHEFEAGETGEAKFARALDNLEVQLQHNRASLDTWEEVEYGLVYTKMDGVCGHDSFLKAFCEEVKAEAEVKMRESGVDTDELRRRVGV